MKFKKMAAVVLAGVTACATVPAAVPVFAADGYDHEAIENAGDITLTMMISGVASDNDFETVHEANHNEAMTIYDVLCYSKDRCHLSHEFININSLSSVRTGNLSPNRGFFQNTADFFNGKTVALRNACISLSGKELEKGDVAFKLNLFPFLPIIIRFWEADDEFPASLQILADRNTLDYMHYETLMFALTHLFSRLKEEMRIEKG